MSGKAKEGPRILIRHRSLAVRTDPVVESSDAPPTPFMSQIPADLRDLVKSLFVHADTDNSKTVDVDEFKKVLAELLPKQVGDVLRMSHLLG